MLWLILTIALPLGILLSKSFDSADGNPLSNYIRYFSTPALVSSLWNSLIVATVTMVIVIPLAFAYAYALTRTQMPLKGLFTAIALLPLFAPSLLPAISFIYMFGNQGIFTGFMKSIFPGFSVRGPLGIVLSQVFYCFPQALLILMTALRLADQRLYEVADALATRPIRVFRTVTLPGVMYGLVSAAFVVFTLVITDFGIAKVIGEGFEVLATEAYKQVIGQQNFAMGAVVGFVLLVPAVVAFFIDRQVQKRQVALLSARAVPFEPKRHAAADTFAALYCTLICLLILVVILIAAWGSFITYWPYNKALTLKNYDFENFIQNGWGTYYNSLLMAACTAIVGTVIVFTGAYLVDKTDGFRGGRSLAHFLAMLPMAVPGLVLGLGYIFFVNAKWNPLNVFYGTLAVLVVNSIAHFYTVAHITALTALKQIDPEFESVSASLKVPFYRTFARVTAPICLPAILDIGIYMFVNALTTVSAVIFIYGPNTVLASIAIVQMDEAGQTAAAAGMSIMLLITALAARLFQLALSKFMFGPMQAWRKR
ncbi:MAG: putative 2-aminoethylphosphonate ABC transporter permease subunit [Hyphomicrobiaceae bacterium]|nr:MAG: putative 2-aminoethylphosphonate ABC transporter permease subunit [Hyphomicrobiaceae bacterium]